MAAAQVIAAMLGLSTPIIIGAATGHLSGGVAASLGGLALGVQVQGGTAHERLLALVYALVAGSAAMFIGAALAGKGSTGISVIAVAAAAALCGSLSRPLMRATTQFIIFLIIAANMNTNGMHPAGITLLFAAGALWTALLSLLLDRLFRAVHPSRERNNQAAAKVPVYALQQRLGYWTKSLSHLAGWQYTLRIMLCLGAAEIIRRFWPYDHSYWMSLTVAIVVHRDLRQALTRTFHRALGTLLGVLLISILLLGLPPLWIMISLVALLAGARPVLIGINYIAYVTAVTPLIILLLDFGKEPTLAVITNRLIATAIGCLISLILSYAAWARFAGSAKRAGAAGK